MSSRDDIRDDMIAGLADRARNLLRALDRQDRLETADAFIGWLPRQTEERKLAATTEELLLRALATAGDPLNFRLLAQLDSLEGLEVSDLMDRTGLGRVAVSERINDLVQVGLASREMLSDQIRGTRLGAALVTVVGDIAAESAARLAGELSAEIGSRVKSHDG